MEALSQGELAAALERLVGWEVREGALVREWRFRNFQEAMSFVYWVAELAEEEEHHPDIDVRYSKVRLALTTHDADGITEKDVAMAARVSARFEI